MYIAQSRASIPVTRSSFDTTPTQIEVDFVLGMVD